MSTFVSTNSSLNFVFKHLPSPSPTLWHSMFIWHFEPLSYSSFLLMHNFHDVMADLRTEETLLFVGYRALVPVLRSLRWHQLPHLSNSLSLQTLFPSPSDTPCWNLWPGKIYASSTEHLLVQCIPLNSV